MYLVFDIGGTSTRFAASKDGEHLSRPAQCDTPKNFEEAMELFRKTALEVAGGERIRAAAGGARALDKTKKKLRAQPHFPLWVEEPLEEELSKAFGADVHLENDAALAGLGEAVYGAGKGFDIVAYLTVSTGVGGARITEGAIDKAAQGFEPGNQVISEKEPFYLEAYISGTAFEKRYGKKPREVTDPAAWDEAARILARGLANSIVHWSPDIVVLGGSMILGDPAISLDATETYLKEVLKVFPELPPLKKAELGDAAGLWGALAYLKRHA